MEWKDVGNVVAKAAPILGTVLGGPVGAIVGGAGSLIASKLGVEPEPDAIMRRIQADPEALVRIAEIEAGERSRLLDWQTRQAEFEIEDRKSARSRDVQVREASGFNWRGDALAIIAIGGLVSLIWLLVFVTIPDGPARDVLLLLSGGLVTIVKDVYAFEFGSSRGSKAKDAQLAVRAGNAGDLNQLREDLIARGTGGKS